MIDSSTKNILVGIHEQLLAQEVNLQVIFQILVKHNITTHEEVQAMRSYIYKQPKYSNMLKSLQDSRKTVDEGAKFEELMTRVLTNGDKQMEEILTPEEKDFLMSRLERSKI